MLSRFKRNRRNIVRVQLLLGLPAIAYSIYLINNFNNIFSYIYDMASKQVKTPKQKKTPDLNIAPSTVRESNIAARWALYFEKRPNQLFPTGSDIENLQQAQEYLSVLWIMDKRWYDYTPNHLKWQYPESGHITIPILINYYISYRNEQIGVPNNMPQFLSSCNDFKLICMLLGDNSGICQVALQCRHAIV